MIVEILLAGILSVDTILIDSQMSDILKPQYIIERWISYAQNQR